MHSCAASVLLWATSAGRPVWATLATERLARSRGPQQRLVALAAVHPLHQLLDRRRLITLRGVGRRQVVSGHDWAERCTGSVTLGGVLTTKGHRCRQTRRPMPCQNLSERADVNVEDERQACVQMRAVTALLRASRNPRTTATIASSSFKRFTADPTPTPAAPAAIAIGTVTADRPDAHSTGTAETRLMLWAAAKWGRLLDQSQAAGAEGLGAGATSVWIRSAPAATRSMASCSCWSIGSTWGR